MEKSTVDVLDGHNPKQGREQWLALQFARLAVFALTLGLVAVPVTCVDAHGPHSLYAPPDVRASFAAVTLSTHDHHNHHHGDGATETSGGHSGVSVPSSPDDNRPVVNAVGMAQLVSGDLVAITPGSFGEREGQVTRLLIAEPLTAHTTAIDLLESPPPR